MRACVRARVDTSNIKATKFHALAQINASALTRREKKQKTTNIQRAVVHAVVFILREAGALVPNRAHSWMSIVQILIF